MTNDEGTPQIRLNTERKQFECDIAGQKAFLEYQFQGKSLVLTHTEVPGQLQGRGIGSALTKAALDYAASEQLTVLPFCPFVEEYIRKQPEYLAVIEPDYRKRWFAAPGTR